MKGSMTCGLLVALLLAARPGAAQDRESCADDPGFRTLDFWVGRWTVWSDGQQVGTNRIFKVQDGCAVEEQWEDAGGGTGQSLFYYLPASGVWKQVWVTPFARHAGGIKEKVRVDAPGAAVRFQGTIERADGTTYLDRTTLTPLDGGRVRQHIEVSTDGGESWRTTFDAEYRPVDRSPGQGAADRPSTDRMAHPEWSPDGSRLVFEATWDGSPNVWLMRTDGTGARQLTAGNALDSYPRFSPGGDTVVFLSRRDSLFSMHLIELDSGRETPFLGVGGNLEPAFHPNGRQVVFRSYLGGRDRDGEILLADVSGGEPRPLTDNDVEDGYPSFSPDGRTVFFHRAVDGHRQVMMKDLGTGTETQLTNGAYDSWHAHASPDGRAIVFDAERYGSRDVFVMDLTTRRTRRITSHPARDGYPKFSPNGRRIAFHSDRSGTTGIYVVDLEGGVPVPIEPVRRPEPSL